MNSDKIQAKILDPTKENIKLCADYIVNGGIVGMPTETVYGLAANAFNIDAVQNIFKYKGRPLSDPLIVHITSIDMAKGLVNIDSDINRLFEALANKYWPGPLTMVLKANFDKISKVLTANTDFVGVRYPNNKIAQDLINISKCPLAAPSANKFCHISPVNPLHVQDDFKKFPVYILDGGVCNFCMESSVVKIIKSENNTKLQILRMGAISPENFKEFLSKEGFNDVIVEVSQKKIEVKKQITEETESQEAPGQFLKHYSPKIDTYIVNMEKDKNKITNNYYSSEINYTNNMKQEVVIIDYKNNLKNIYGDKFTNYLDLAVDGNAETAMHNLYSYLRESENIENAKMVLLCDLEYCMDNNEHKLTLLDRIQKAASFKKLNVNINN